MVNPRDIAGERKKKNNKIIIINTLQQQYMAVRDGQHVRLTAETDYCLPLRQGRQGRDGREGGRGGGVRLTDGNNVTTNPHDWGNIPSKAFFSGRHGSSVRVTLQSWPTFH